MTVERLENEEALSTRQRGGYLFLPETSVIELSGKDAESFLHGRSSNDVKSLQIGQGQLSSLLDRKGYLISFLSVHRLDNERFWILSDRSQSKTILQQFETYHFREKISYKEIADQYQALALVGPASEAFLSTIYKSSASSSNHALSKNNHTISKNNQTLPQALQEEYSIAELNMLGYETVCVKRSLTGDCGFIAFLKSNDADTVLSKIAEPAQKHGLQQIAASTLETLRIEAGHPIFGKDISEEHLLPETGLEQYAASYNKGCFQGQEVLARIKTYGAPRRALVGLIFEDTPSCPFPLNSNFSVSGEESGCIKSNCFSPALGKHIALAYIARDYRVPDRRVEIETESGKYKTTVKFLPFYSASSSKERAHKLYNEALQEFAHDSEERAIRILREVIELDPLHADAYESLGVILSRHEQYDEAIALMHRLKDLIPDSVMAHTNLSIYYMHLGDKDRAEEEKAIAMSIRMSQLASEHAKQKKEEAEKKLQLDEQERRLEMFHQVLQIDPDDFLANNGVGTVYVELGKYEESIPFLQKAIAVKTTHTVAYLALGKAYEHLNRTNDAIEIYKAGINIAAKRGDITPMKEMQGLLYALESKSIV